MVLYFVCMPSFCLPVSSLHTSWPYCLILSNFALISHSPCNMFHNAWTAYQICTFPFCQKLPIAFISHIYQSYLHIASQFWEWEDGGSQTKTFKWFSQYIFYLRFFSWHFSYINWTKGSRRGLLCSLSLSFSFNQCITCQTFNSNSLIKLFQM